MMSRSDERVPRNRAIKSGPWVAIGHSGRHPFEYRIRWGGDFVRAAEQHTSIIGGCDLAEVSRTKVLQKEMGAIGGEGAD